MRKLFVALSILAVGVFAANGASAQSCTETLGNNLRACIDNGVTACADSITECDPLDYSLTVDDVREIAINRCCGLNTTRARKSCLLRERRKYVATIPAGDQRSFFVAARNEIAALRSSDCGNNSYQDVI